MPRAAARSGALGGTTHADIRSPMAAMGHQNASWATGDARGQNAWSRLGAAPGAALRAGRCRRHGVGVGGWVGDGGGRADHIARGAPRGRPPTAIGAARKPRSVRRAEGLCGRAGASSRARAMPRAGGRTRSRGCAAVTVAAAAMLGCWACPAAAGASELRSIRVAAAPGGSCGEGNVRAAAARGT